MANTNISHLLPSSINTVNELSKEKIAIQVESSEDLNNLAATFDGMSGMNALARSRQSKSIEELKSSATEKEGETEETEEGKVLQVEEMEELAQQFQKNNYELNAKTLMILRERVKPDDSSDEVLQKVNSTYTDPSLADDALDFLLQTAPPKGKEAIKAAREELNATYGREIKAGRNMGAQAREFSQEGLGSPESLRNLYRDLTGMQREPLKLFTDLTEKFSFNKMKAAINFLLHSLGSDLKSKGPSIAPGELKKLVDDTRSLQGILGVFRFFQSRMHILMSQFASNSLLFPEKLDYELLARAFIRLIQERYINPDKIRQMAHQLGIEEELLAQIIVYNQMREAIRQVAPRYYRNEQHKEELTKSFIDLLEQLEDEYEEEEENES